MFAVITCLILGSGVAFFVRRTIELQANLVMHNWRDFLELHINVMLVLQPFVLDHYLGEHHLGSPLRTLPLNYLYNCLLPSTCPRGDCLPPTGGPESSERTCNA